MGGEWVVIYLFISELMVSHGKRRGGGGVTAPLSSLFDVFAFTASERSLIPSGHNRGGGMARKSISICAN